MTVDLDKAQREETRWRILRALNAGRPLAVAESVILRALADASLPITPIGLRRELGYLRDKGLVSLSGQDGLTWAAALSAAGVDVIEYSVAAPPGIARPEPWW